MRGITCEGRNMARASICGLMAPLMKESGVRIRLMAGGSISG